MSGVGGSDLDLSGSDQLAHQPLDVPPGRHTQTHTDRQTQTHTDRHRQTDTHRHRQTQTHTDAHTGPTLNLPLSFTLVFSLSLSLWLVWLFWLSSLSCSFSPPQIEGTKPGERSASKKQMKKNGEKGRNA
eukprot:3218654-Rhodomonas_salina.1